MADIPEDGEEQDFEFLMNMGGDIFSAIDHGDAELVRQLINQGQDVNVYRNGVRPLQAAISFKIGQYREIIRLLLRAGARIQQGDLHTAARSKDPHVVKLLLENGAKINEKNFKGRTSLDVSLGAQIYTPTAPIARLLIENGADITEPYTEERTLLSRAVLTGDESLVRSIVKNGTVNVQSYDWRTKTWGGDTPLHIASRYRPSIVKILLQSGADLNIKNTKGETPIDVDKTGAILKYLGAKAVPEIGIKKGIPAGPVSDIQEFLIGKRPTLPDTPEGRRQREENLKKRQEQKAAPLSSAEEEQISTRVAAGQSREEAEAEIRSKRGKGRKTRVRKTKRRKTLRRK